MKNYPLGIADLHTGTLTHTVKAELIDITQLGINQNNQFIQDIEKAIAIYHASQILFEKSFTRTVKDNRSKLRRDISTLMETINSLDEHNRYTMVDILAGEWQSFTDTLERADIALRMTDEELQQNLASQGKPKNHPTYDLAYDIAKTLKKFGIPITTARPSANSKGKSTPAGQYYRCVKTTFCEIGIHISDLRPYLKYGKQELSKR